MHQCDLSKQTYGGLLTLSRALSVLIDVLNHRNPAALDDVDDCLKCRTLLTMNLAALLARAAIDQNPDARMGFEMGFAAAQAALDRGEIDTPPDGL